MPTSRLEMISQSGTMWGMETRFFLNIIQRRTIGCRTSHFCVKDYPSFSLWLLMLSAKQIGVFYRATTQSKRIISMTRSPRSRKLSWKALKSRSSAVWRATEMAHISLGAPYSTLGWYPLKMFQSSHAMRKKSKHSTRSKHATFWRGKLHFAGCEKLEQSSKMMLPRWTLLRVI